MGYCNRFVDSLLYLSSISISKCNLRMLRVKEFNLSIFVLHFGNCGLYSSDGL